MDNPEMKLTVSVEAALRLQIREVLQRASSEFGVQITRASIDWIDISDVRGPRFLVRSVKLDTMTQFPSVAAVMSVPFTWDNVLRFFRWASEKDGYDAPYVCDAGKEALTIDGEVSCQDVEEWIAQHGERADIILATERPTPIVEPHAELPEL